jgi:hypothetical protein
MLKHNVKIISHYTDKNGQFHLVGQITNPGKQELMTSLQATVYTDSTRSSVADAANFNTLVPIQPGETLPFDLTGWGALNSTRGAYGTSWPNKMLPFPCVSSRSSPGPAQPV